MSQLLFSSEFEVLCPSVRMQSQKIGCWPYERGEGRKKFLGGWRTKVKLPMNTEMWSLILIKGWRLEWVKLNQQQPDFGKALFTKNLLPPEFSLKPPRSSVHSTNVLSLQDVFLFCLPEDSVSVSLTRTLMFSVNPQWKSLIWQTAVLPWELWFTKKRAYPHEDMLASKTFTHPKNTHALSHTLRDLCDLHPSVLSRCSTPAALIDNRVVYEWVITHTSASGLATLSSAMCLNTQGCMFFHCLML